MYPNNCETQPHQWYSSEKISDPCDYYHLNLDLCLVIDGVDARRELPPKFTAIKFD